MKSIYELCTPRDEVLEGELREDIFAARLKDVIDKKAEKVYGDAQTFFDNTYPTSGLITLAKEALGRLTGDGAGRNAVIRLETAFGGGKTHNLIALYHIISGAAHRDIVAKFVGGEFNLPKPGEIKIAGVVGSDLTSSTGMEHDGIRTHTLWGELAYQLGGPEGFALAADSDRDKSAPGTSLWDEVIGDQPALIMIDEIARHLRSALAIPTATGQSTLAEQTAAFIMSLLEFASSKERCLVVLTLADETSAFSDETSMVKQVLSESLSVSARQERVITPTGEDEISAIVTHRLFKQIDRKGAQPVFEEYQKYYTGLIEKNAELPSYCIRAEYRKEMEASYPFHPELLNTLNRKTSTIPNFNKTRGALRLLAWTIRELWKTKKSNPWMIHLHHIDLSQEKIVEDLTSRLERPRFNQVVQADIYSHQQGSPAHAQVVDEPLISSGKPPYAQRLATTIFINSLSQGIASGVDPADLMLSVLEPDSTGGGDDPAVVKRQLEKLYDAPAWFLEYDGHYHRFKTEPSLEKILVDEAGHVLKSRAKSEIEKRIKTIWRSGYFKPVYFPAIPLDVDDNAEQPKLAIMHFDAVSVSATTDVPPEMIQKISQYSGTMESFRNFRNNVIFLVADEDQVENMVKTMRHYLAIERIVGDPSRLSEFNDEQKKELKNKKNAAELDVRVAITKTYRHLYYPTQDAPNAHASLRRETLPPQDSADVDQDQTNVILRVLRNLSKAITANENLQSAQWLKSKAWDLNQVSMTTEDLRKAFARKIGLKILFDVGQLRKTIENGVRTNTWIYYDAREEFGYDKDVPPPAWDISDNVILYTPEEAQRLNIRIKGKWKPKEDEPIGPGPKLDTCPVCGNREDQCTCGQDKVTGRPAKVKGEGAVAQAFQQILDQCQEHDISHLSKLFISIDGADKQGAMASRSLGLAIPQFGKGRFNVKQEVVATFPSDQSEHFKQEFQGSWDRYKRIKNVVDFFGEEASEFSVKMQVEVNIDGGLEVNGDQFLSMRDILNTLDVGRVTLEGVPQVEAAN